MRLGDVPFDKKGFYYNHVFYLVCENEINVIKKMKGWKYLTNDRKKIIQNILTKVFYRFLCDNKDVLIYSEKYWSLPSDFSEYVRLVKRGLKVKRIMSKLKKPLPLASSCDAN